MSDSRRPVKQATEHVLTQQQVPESRPDKIRVVIANRSPIMGSALASLFDSNPEFEVVAKVSSCADCYRSVGSTDVDVIVCDLESEELEGFSPLPRFRNCSPHIPTVVISDDDHEQRILRMVKAGVQGFLTKDASPARLFKAISTVSRGGCYIDDCIQSKLLGLFGGHGVRNPYRGLLNSREREILRLMSNGLTNEQIGNAVCLSKSAVKYHNKSIFKKLDVSNRAEAVKVAIQQALIE